MTVSLPTQAHFAHIKTPTRVEIDRGGLDNTPASASDRDQLRELSRPQQSRKLTPFRPHATTAVVGVNGAGKTTLLRRIADSSESVMLTQKPALPPLATVTFFCATPVSGAVALAVAVPAGQSKVTSTVVPAGASKLCSNTSQATGAPRGIPTWLRP